MNIPGQQVSHQIITHECRTNRGDDGALLEAWNRISEEYWQLIACGLDPQVELHLALIVQMDRHRQPPRTLIGDGNPLPEGVWITSNDKRFAIVSRGEYVTYRDSIYTYVGPVPEEEGK